MVRSSIISILINTLCPLPPICPSDSFSYINSNDSWTHVDISRSTSFAHVFFNPHVFSYLLDQIKLQSPILKSFLLNDPELPCYSLTLLYSPRRTITWWKPTLFLLCTSTYATECGWIISQSYAYWNYFKFMPSKYMWIFNVIHTLPHSPTFILLLCLLSLNLYDCVPHLYYQLMNLLTLSLRNLQWSEANFHILVPSPDGTHLPAAVLTYSTFPPVTID